MEERLQKLLSACGVASRRTAEQYITAGRVTVNGVPAQLGDKADLGTDTIALDGVALRAPTTRTYLLLNKPRGYVTTLSDERGRKNVSELVTGCGARVWPVGRLDLDSEGLLIMTDDGELTNRLTHPGHEVEKEYKVWVNGDAEAALPLLNSTMELDGVSIHPGKARILFQEGETAQISIIIHEGKNRQVRRMCAATGLLVTRLQRVREGNLRLGTLHTGAWRRLTEAEVEQFLTP